MPRRSRVCTEGRPHTRTEPTDEELDMLDLAFGLTETSRLGCQVKMEEDLNGIIVNVPESINDQRIEKSG